MTGIACLGATTGMQRMSAWEQQALQRVLGYLNFSSGTPEPQIRRDVNQLYAACAVREERPWRALADRLQAALEQLHREQEAFADVEQARAVLHISFEHVLPGYRRFHRDLLAHLSEQEMFTPFFVAKVLEAVLRQQGPWSQPEQVAEGAIAELNSFIGYRPVAVLENGRQMEPYAHEWVCPIPLYFRQVGVAWGPAQAVVEKALEILADTSPELLEEACFSLDRLDELAVDPRAFDFEHPVSRRLNYQFGQWDPHCIDSRGYYRRYVVTDITIRGLMKRLQQRGNPDELLFESAAVLAGTILMGSMTTGWGPGCYDSSVTLHSLVPRIARLRDLFYEQLLRRVKGRHGQRLRREARERHQPFASARQGFNLTLMQERAEQLERSFLARLFSRMGYPEASRRQWERIRPATARMRGQLDSLLTSAELALDKRQLDRAWEMLQECEDLLHRAIECGALMDPWNVLGFGGQFPLFHSPDSAMYDFRIDQLVDLLEGLFGLLARLESEAAVANRQQLQQQASGRLHALAAWWDQFATSSVQQVPSFSGREAAESADQVAAALAAWYGAGSAAGDVAFWREHVQEFRSPKAYARVVKTLLDHGDLQASMALLVHWLSQEEVPLHEGEFAFTPLAFYWMNQLRKQQQADAEQRWRQVVRFFDFLAANGEHRAVLPELAETMEPAQGEKRTGAEPSPEEGEEDDGLFAAAYEGMVFRDSAWDGVEGDVDPGAEAAAPGELELERLADQIRHALVFFGTMAELWSLGATVACRDGVHEAQDHVAAWLEQAERFHEQLNRLIDQLAQYPIPRPSSVDPLAMIEYDRHQSIRQGLLDQVIQVQVMMQWALIKLRAIPGVGSGPEQLPPWQREATNVVRLVNAVDAVKVRKAMPRLRRELGKLPLLYLPLERDGDPHELVRVRLLHGLLRSLLMALPRLGLIGEACQVLEMAKAMEGNSLPGRGAISEFDRLFTFGCQAIVEAVIRAGENQRGKRTPPPVEESPLLDCLDELTERLMKLWLPHAQTLRISVLEALEVLTGWDDLVRFIKRYGGDLFTPMFLSDGNLRAVARQGTRSYLRQLRQLAQEGEPDLPRLAQALDREIPLEEAASILELIVHAVLENYAEYNDYNHTTTQSDRGELFYTFLDFLRLKVAYQREAWNLTPLVIVHQVLVQCRQHELARWWRNQVVQRTEDSANTYRQWYEELVQEHGMRLASIEEQINERFVAPMEIDQVAALLPPLLDPEADPEEKEQLLREFEEQVGQLMQTHRGTGLELPHWAVTLEQELERVRMDQMPELAHRRLEDIPWQKVSFRQVCREVNRWNPQAD